MDKHDKKQILETYFMIVHNLKKAQHLTNQCFHSELYGDGYLAKIDLIYHMAPIISKNKEISIFQNRLILKDEYKTSKELFFTPKNVKEIVRLYKEGKNICASSYMIREQYFNNDIGWFKSIVLSIDEEKILLEIERKIAILEFTIYVYFNAGYLKDINFEKKPNQELFIILFKLFLARMKKQSKDGRYIYQLVKEFYPHFGINIYGVLEYALNGTNDKELSDVIYNQIKKELHE